MSRLASITCLLALACAPSAEITEPPSSTTDTQPSSTTAEPTADGEVSSGPIQLSQFETTLTVTTGTELSYSYKSHASVGFGAEFEIGNPTVLTHVRTDMQYEQSEQERAGKTGADAATGTFVFQASAPGSSTLRVTELFRGETQVEVEYAITVVDP